MQLLTTPHPARGPPPSSLPRRLLADLTTFSKQADIDGPEPMIPDSAIGTTMDSAPLSSAVFDSPTAGGAAASGGDPLAVSLEGVSVGLAYRFVRVLIDASNGFSIWRPVFGAESDQSDISSPVLLEESMRSSSWASDDDVIALPLGDVLSEGAMSLASHSSYFFISLAILRSL